MNPRIQTILEVKPFTVKVKWTNGQTKIVDFSEFLAEERGKKHPLFSKLFDWETFSKVQTDGRTLYWKDMGEMQDEDGKIIPAAIDFCPDVLFNFSKEI
jgi:hypothetical protein